MVSEKVNPDQKSEEKVVDRILKQLTPENIQKQIKEIGAIELPQELNMWIKEYEKIGDRDKSIWKWIYGMMPLITSPIINENRKESIIQTKCLVLITFAVLLNDVADTIQDDKLLKELLKVPLCEKSTKLEDLSQKEKEYLLFTEKLWNHTLNILKQYPRYQEFKKILDFDISQILISNQHDHLVTLNHYFNNQAEAWLYPAHTMGGMICGDIDLMSSDNFDIKNLGLFREIIWHAQKMARIGNWISTWEREVYENDFTSKVILDAINSGVLNIEELKEENKLKIVKKIKNSEVEERLLQKWENSYKKIKSLGEKISDFNVDKLLNNLEKLLFLELSSRKYK